ncbi:MAG: hypothetical protein JJE50_15335, partial [Actinomycetales bacterium]|nr:hypothetical protein [Actinomycetales bacterium]
EGRSRATGVEVTVLEVTVLEVTVLEVTVLEGAGRTTRRQVDDLATAGPDERVFVVERDGGRIRFGYGEHGRRPYRPTILEVHYRTGVGAVGAVDGVPVVLPLEPGPGERPSTPPGVIRQIVE